MNPRSHRPPSTDPRVDDFDAERRTPVGVVPRLTRGPLSLAGARQPVPSAGRILLVEPDADVATMLRLSLQVRLPSTRAIWCPDPTHAARLMRGSAFDLVICEPVASGDGGLALVRMLGADPRTAEVPVVILTSSGEGERTGTRDCPNIDGWFTKPIDMPTFVSFVGRVLGAH